MNQTNNRDLNDAIFGGILVFSVVFFSMKDLFSPDNQNIFIMLILVYLFASICRIFGIILESPTINNIGLHYCRLILIPLTVWATTAIILTEIRLSVFSSLVSFYFFVIAEFLILTNTYGIRFTLQSPLVLDFGKKFKKE